MVRPSHKKEIAARLIKKKGCSRRIACEVLSLSRASTYYESQKDDSAVISKLEEYVSSHPNRGFDTYYWRIRREGLSWSRNKVLRVYREQGLVRRKRSRRRLPEGIKKPLYNPDTLNEIWSMDFMSDCLSDGRNFRVLNVMDDYSRELLSCQGSLSMPSARVIRVLEELIENRKAPKFIRTDNGPEFISKEYKSWCERNSITPVYSTPGRPMENGYIERMNRTFREEVLDAYLFHSFKEYHQIAIKWMEDYNHNHPHKSLGRKSPREVAQGKLSCRGLAPYRRA